MSSLGTVVAGSVLALSETVESGTNVLMQSFDAALKTVQSDVLSYAATALPYALVIAGTFIAIRLGIGFFRSVAH